MTREEQIKEAAMKDCSEHCNNRGYFSFVAGVKWADEHPKPKWIKFKDEKPGIGHLNCVIVNQGENVFIAHLDYYSAGLYWNMYGHGSMPVLEDDKWMPIPKLEEE